MSVLTCGVCGGDVGQPTEVDDFEPCHCAQPFIEGPEGRLITACAECGEWVTGPHRFLCNACIDCKGELPADPADADNPPF